MILETYRECLQDVFDLPALRALLQGLKTRELDLVEVETQSASPFARSLLFDYIATYMYEGDAPLAERRAQALSLDRDLLRELLGQEELRDLLDHDAVDEVERQLQGDPKTPDHLHDKLRLRGDLRAGEYDPALAEPLLAERRALLVRDRGRGAADRRRGRGPLSRRARRDAAVGPARRVPRRRARLAAPARAALREGPRAVHDRAGERALRPRRVGDPRRPRARRAARARRASSRAAPSASGATPTCCAACGARRSPRCARRSSRSSRKRSRGSCPAGTASTAAHRCARRSFRCRRSALPVALWEAEVLPRRVPGFRPEHLDALTASGEVVWVGAGPDRVALYFREDASVLGQVPAAPRPEGEEHDKIRAALAGALFFDELLAETQLEEAVALPALWDLVWAGEVTNDAWTPLRASRRFGQPKQERRPRRFSRRRALGATATAGRWSRTERLFAGAPDRRALAELLLERQGIVTRDGVRGEGIPGGYGAVYAELRALETLGLCRRGYFVEGLGGAQFALGGAVERIRELRERGEDADALVLAAADPGTAVRRRAAVAEARRCARRARRRRVCRVARRRAGALRRARRTLARAAARPRRGRGCARRSLRSSRTCVAAERSGSPSSASTASRSSRPTRCRCSSRQASSPGRGAPSYARSFATISAAGRASRARSSRRPRG